MKALLCLGLATMALVACTESGSGRDSTGSSKSSVSCTPDADGGPAVCTTATGDLITVGPVGVGDANCAHGGVQIDTGFDADSDGALSLAEVEGTEYICNGAPGSAGPAGVASLVAVVSLTAGQDPACSTGGSRIDTGADSNGSGILDALEITSSSYVCTGAAGPAGAAGSDGLNALSATALELAGPNCAAGGLRVDNGLDQNRDGTLQPGEVTSTSYVCNGINGGGGGAGSLVAVVPELVGENCATGGVAIQSGSDVSGDGTLQPGEVTATSYICNGSSGAGKAVIAATPIVQGGVTLASGTSATLQTAAITIPVSGVIVAIASAKAYCDYSASGYDCAAAPNYTVAHLTIGQSGVGGQSGTSGTATYLYLTPEIDHMLTTTEVFNVAAGTYSFDAIGLPGVTPAGTAAVYYDMAELTLVFIPN